MSYQPGIFQERVIKWYKKNGRSFIWRDEQFTLWQWLVLEILLKRTRAERVELFFKSFITKYKNPSRIYRIKEKELEKDLHTLGLYKQRTSALKVISKILVEEYDSKIPTDPNILSSIPHIGAYIANAVLCFSEEQRLPLIDSNISRIYSRVFGVPIPRDTRIKWLWEQAESMLPIKEVREYNYGLIDLGAMVCKPHKPDCISCCLTDLCRYSTNQ